MAIMYRVVLLMMMKWLLLSTTVAEQPGIREKRASIPGAVLWRGMINSNREFGLRAILDKECPKGDPHYVCPEGWTSVDESEGIACLLFVEDPLPQANASSFCQSQGGNLVTILTSERQRNVQSLLEGVDGNVWTGLFQAMYSRTFYWPNNIQMKYNKFQSTVYGNYMDACVYMSSPSRAWERTYECNTALSFVCDLRPECSPGWYGPECRQECHCLGQTCEWGTPCTFGCQLGWLEPHCCAKKEAADIAHYCMNTADDGRHMILRVDPKSVAYDVFMPVDVAGQPLPWCADVKISLERDGRYTFIIPVDGDNAGVADAGHSSVENRTRSNEDCGQEKTGENAYSWRLLLQEKKGLLLPLDRTLVLTCDFSNAESLSRSSQYSVRTDDSKLGGGLYHWRKKPMDAKEDVVLQVIDPFSGDVIQQAALGSSVALRMRLNIAQAVRAQGVAPYQCRAASLMERARPSFTTWPGAQVLIPLLRLNQTFPRPQSFLSRSNFSRFPITAMSSFPASFVSALVHRYKTIVATPVRDTMAEEKKFQWKYEKRHHQNPHSDRQNAQDVDAMNTSNYNQSNGAEMMTPVTWFLVVIVMLMSVLLVYVLYRSSRRPQVRLIR